MKRGRSTSHRALPARLRSVFRVSHPLDGLLSPLPFRPCFMSVALVGFRPSELFPSSEAVTPLGARSPPAGVVAPRLRHLASPIASSSVRETKPRIVVARRQRSAATTDFRVCHLAGVRHQQPRQMPRHRGVALMGFCLSRAFSAPDLDVRFRTSSSRELARLDLAPSRRRLPRRCAGSSESHSTRLPARWLSPPCLPS
jgi:hypothetical protein